MKETLLIAAAIGAGGMLAFVYAACRLAGEVDDQTELMLGQMDGRDE